MSGNRDKDLEDPQGYGRVEYAYHLMARDAGIEMTECRLLAENDRSHFMTRRFDRGPGGEKLFVQTLCALAHMDFNQAGAYGYEQAMQVGERLGLPRPRIEQLFRRMVFNVMARNQDDHTKNIAFIMDRSGRWDLAPAYDVIYSYNPAGAWTSRHQMTVNGKQGQFDIGDLRAVADRFGLFRGPRLEDMLQALDRVLGEWPRFASIAGVPEAWTGEIADHHRRRHSLR